MSCPTELPLNICGDGSGLCLETEGGAVVHSDTRPLGEQRHTAMDDRPIRQRGKWFAMAHPTFAREQLGLEVACAPRGNARQVKVALLWRLAGWASRGCATALPHVASFVGVSCIALAREGWVGRPRAHRSYTLRTVQKALHKNTTTGGFLVVGPSGSGTTAGLELRTAHLCVQLSTQAGANEWGGC
jgi:hypothetical protein